MTSIQPAWLGVLIVVITLVAEVLVVIGALYVLVPPARRFIKGDQPVWWVRDLLIVAFLTVFLLFGRGYLVGAAI